MLLRKTAAGQAEVGGKTHQLPARARSLLILIDGKRSLDELRGMLGPAVDEAVQLLLGQGLVEALAAAPVAAKAPAAPSAAPVAPAPPAMADWQSRRRDAARAVTEAMGPMGDGLAMRLERAKNAEELDASLRLAVQVLEGGVGSAKAEAFRQRFLGA